MTPNSAARQREAGLSLGSGEPLARVTSSLYSSFPKRPSALTPAEAAGRLLLHNRPPPGKKQNQQKSTRTDWGHTLRSTQTTTLHSSYGSKPSILKTVSLGCMGISKPRTSGYSIHCTALKSQTGLFALIFLAGRCSSQLSGSAY